MGTVGRMQEGGIYTTDVDTRPPHNPRTKYWAHLSSRLHQSRGQSSVLESWISLGSSQLPGSSFRAYESPPTANRRVYWWGFSTLPDGSRRILPPSGQGSDSGGRRDKLESSLPESAF